MLDEEMTAAVQRVVNAVMALPQEHWAPYAKTYALAIPRALSESPREPLKAVESQLLYVQSNLDGGRGEKWKEAREATKAALKLCNRKQKAGGK